MLEAAIWLLLLVWSIAFVTSIVETFEMSGRIKNHALKNVAPVSASQGAPGLSSFNPLPPSEVFDDEESTHPL